MDLTSDYGWSKPHYLNKQLKELTSEKELLYSASAYSHTSIKTKKVELMDEALKKADLMNFPKTDFERICIYNSKKNQILSVFAHIRNSFAHCRYNVVDIDSERVYCFKYVEPKIDSSGNVKVSARIIQYESTLLRWIDLIERGEVEYNFKRFYHHY